MNAKQIGAVMALAEQPPVKPVDYELAERIYNGKGTVYAFPEDLVPIVRYQCMYLSGGWDMEEMQDLCNRLRWRVTILGAMADLKS
jgi:hypothetical protein